MGFRARGSPYKRARTGWHIGFALLVEKRSPSGFVVRFEVPLSLQPRCIDQLIVRRTHKRGRARPATVLRGLWQHLTDVTILEFKGPTRGFRPGDLVNLLSYAHQYYAQYITELAGPKHLSLVLVLPAWSRSLAREIDQLEMSVSPLGKGYTRLTGGLYNIFVIPLDEVSDAERDDYLRIFTKTRDVASVPALRWMQSWVIEGIRMDKLKLTDDEEQIIAKYLRSMDRARKRRLIDALGPEICLAGLDPKQRLAGLDPEQRLSLLKQCAADLNPEQIRAILGK